MTVSESCEVSISREQSAKYAPYICRVSFPPYSPLLYHKAKANMKRLGVVRDFRSEIHVFKHFNR